MIYNALSNKVTELATELIETGELRTSHDSEVLGYAVLELQDEVERLRLLMGRETTREMDSGTLEAALAAASER